VPKSLTHDSCLNLPSHTQHTITTTMSNVKKIQKAFRKEDPAGLDSDEMELYSQMKEAAEENPEAAEATRKKMKKQVGTGKGREARAARERQQGRAPVPRTRAIAGGSNTTTTPPTSTTPLSSPPTSSFSDFSRTHLLLHLISTGICLLSSRLYLS
jgi:hypothetical protein